MDLALARNWVLVILQASVAILKFVALAYEIWGISGSAMHNYDPLNFNRQD